MLRIVAALVAVLAWLPPAAAQDKRVALVIGNAEYKHVFSLKNPVNDAADIGAALKRMGFSVTALNNASAEATRQALADFGAKTKSADTAFVFFAGHAIEANGVTWLIPVDGKADTLADVEAQAVSLDRVIAHMTDAAQLAMVVIDAARNNPFADGRNARPPAGKAEPRAIPRNALIAYATAAGRKVSDGDGRNSPYTAALLKHIETPGFELTRLLGRVRDDVIAATKAQQIPFTYATLSGDAYLMPR